MDKIVIGCDHAGFDLKNLIISNLKTDFNYEISNIVDVGCFNYGSVDYPVIANLAVDKIVSGECTNGILICGTGIGMSMVANRNAAIRAVVSDDMDSIRLSRDHNNANILCLGARTMRLFNNNSKLFSILNAFINTPFSEAERHINRILQFSGNSFQFIH